HQRDGFPLLHVEGNAVHREDVPSALAEGDGEVAYGEKRQSRGVHQAKVFLGSKASRTASPMKISSDSMMATEKKPVSPSQGACTFALPWARISPRDGEPGGRPKPRKSSA